MSQITKRIARLYHPSRHNMQMGRAKTKHWVLEFEPTQKERRQHQIEPLMNWPDSSDTQNQVVLSFQTRDQALNYSKNQDLEVREIITHTSDIKPKAYADNFAASRRE